MILNPEHTIGKLSKLSVYARAAVRLYRSRFISFSHSVVIDAQ